jgi:hypothetical protein
VASTELQEIVALALVFVVHVIGGLLLVWALLDDETRAGWRRRWGRGGEGPEPEPPAPTPSPAAAPRPALPLADADPSRLRLRGPGRLADARPFPLRRPGHAPRPTRLPR